MKWGKVLEQLHYLDPELKDCVRLIPDGIESQYIPMEERCGLYPEEFNRLTEIAEKREAKRIADQNARNDQADAEVLRLRAENERYNLAKAEASGEMGQQARCRESSRRRKSGLSITPKYKSQGSTGIVRSKEREPLAMKPSPRSSESSGAILRPSGKSHRTGQDFPGKPSYGGCTSTPKPL